MHIHNPEYLELSIHELNVVLVCNVSISTAPLWQFTIPTVCAHYFACLHSLQNTLTQNHQCVFWDFIGNTTGTTSGWSNGSITTDSTIDGPDGSVTVTCLSTHLTSFAVLVDASGQVGHVY